MNDNLNLLLKSSNQFLDFLANLFIVCVKITVEVGPQNGQSLVLEEQNLKEAPAELDDQFLDRLFELYWELFVMAEAQAQNYLENLEIILQRLQAFTDTNWITLSTLFIGPLLVLGLAYYNKNINLVVQRVKSIVLTKPDATFSPNRGGLPSLRAIRRFNPFRMRTGRIRRSGGAGTYVANRWRSFRYRVPLLSNDYEDLNPADRAARISSQTIVAQHLNSEISELIIRDFEIKLDQTYLLDPPAFEMNNHTRRAIAHGLNQNPLYDDSSNPNITQFLSNVANYDFQLAQKLSELQKVSDDVGSRIITLRNARRDTAIFISKARILIGPPLTENKLLFLNELLRELMINLGFLENELGFADNANIDQFVQSNNIDGLLDYLLTGEINNFYSWIRPPKLFLVKRCERFFQYHLPFLQKVYDKYSLFMTIWTMTFAVDTCVVERLIGNKIKEIQSSYDNQLSPNSSINNNVLKIGSSIFFTEALNTINSREEHFNPVYWYETISCLSEVEKENILANLNCVIANLFNHNANILRENPQLIWLYKIIYEDLIVSQLLQKSQEEPFQEQPFQEGVQESKED
jgi:hypothetical protein